MYIQVSGARLFVREMGDGIPLTLVHGACADSGYFDACLPYLTPACRVTIYDRRGSGKSTVSGTAGYTLQEQADDLAAVLSAAPQPAVVAAHSLGCAIALQCAAEHPGLFRKLILYEPQTREHWLEDPRCAGQWKKIRQLIDSGIYSAAGYRFLALLGGGNEPSRPIANADMSAVLSNMEVFIKNELPLLSEALAMPEDVSVVLGAGVGSLETPFGKTARILRERHPAWKFALFPGTHNAPVARAEEFSKRVLEII